MRIFTFTIRPGKDEDNNLGCISLSPIISSYQFNVDSSKMWVIQRRMNVIGTIYYSDSI